MNRPMVNDRLKEHSTEMLLLLLLVLLMLLLFILLEVRLCNQEEIVFRLFSVTGSGGG